MVHAPIDGHNNDVISALIAAVKLRLVEAGLDVRTHGAVVRPNASVQSNGCVVTLSRLNEGKILQTCSCACHTMSYGIRKAAASLGLSVRRGSVIARRIIIL